MRVERGTSFTAGPTCFSTLDDSPAAPPKRATQSWVNFLHTLVDRIHAHVLSLCLSPLFSRSSSVLKSGFTGYEILFNPIHPSPPSLIFMFISCFVRNKIEVMVEDIVNFCNAVNDFKLKDIVKLFVLIVNNWKILLFVTEFLFLYFL